MLESLSINRNFDKRTSKRVIAINDLTGNTVVPTLIVLTSHFSTIFPHHYSADYLNSSECNIKILECRGGTELKLKDDTCLLVNNLCSNTTLEVLDIVANDAGPDLAWALEQFLQVCIFSPFSFLLVSSLQISR
jgi:hypothetical protein